MNEVTMNLVGPVVAAGGPALKAGEHPKQIGMESPVAVVPERADRTVEAERAAGRQSEAIDDAAEMINRTLAEGQRELRFAVDDASGMTVVYVMHSQTGEVLRQIPSEVVIAIAKLVESGEPVRSLGIEFRT